MGSLKIALAVAVVVLGYSLAPAQNSNRLSVVHLKGSPYERGVTHGRQLKSQIHELVGLWKNDLKETLAPDAEKFVHAFVRETDFTPAIRKWCPDLLEEVRGIADGAELPFETIYAFQLADEVWVNGSQIAKKLKAEHCSSLGCAAVGTKASWIAQNVDLENFRNGFQTVLHIAESPSGPEQYVFTFAGYIGANGLNRHGIGICVNALIPLAHAREGLPVAFVVRNVLQQRNDADAERFLRSNSHTTGQNYILGTPNRVLDFECSAGKVVQFSPLPGSTLVYHTNHPLTNDNYDAEFTARIKRMDSNAKVFESTRARFDSLEARFKQQTNGLSYDLIPAALRSKDSDKFPVCVPLRTGSYGFTFGSTIMRLSPDPEFHVSCGPPDANAYSVFRFGDEK
jgi:isopenicillin-N N-acyltransferase-like protein